MAPTGCSRGVGHLRYAEGGEVAQVSAKFKVGDHVRWNSEAGPVSGKIIRVHKID